MSIGICQSGAQIGNERERLGTGEVTKREQKVLEPNPIRVRFHFGVILIRSDLRKFAQEANVRDK